MWLQALELVSDHDHYLRTRARDYSPELLYRHIQALMFPAGSYVTAQRVRLNFTECTDGPTIWEFQLFPPDLGDGTNPLAPK